MKQYIANVINFADTAISWRVKSPIKGKGGKGEKVKRWLRTFKGEKVKE